LKSSYAQACWKEQHEASQQRTLRRFFSKKPTRDEATASEGVLGTWNGINAKDKVVLKEKCTLCTLPPLNTKEPSTCLNSRYLQDMWGIALNAVQVHQGCDNQNRRRKMGPTWLQRVLVDVGLDKHLDEVAVRHDVSEEAGGGQTRSADHMAMDADETSQ
jgi:hypothetical protein